VSTPGSKPSQRHGPHPVLIREASRHGPSEGQQVRRRFSRPRQPRARRVDNPLGQVTGPSEGLGRSPPLASGSHTLSQGYEPERDARGCECGLARPVPTPIARRVSPI
jgi:hypothetical protein